MRDCTEASWAKTLAGVEGSYYGGTAESFILVRQMRRCGWDKGPQARAIYDAYERSGNKYMFQWGMIGFVTGEISREEYIEFGKTYMRRASEKLDGPLNWAVVTVAVEMAARTCVIDPRKTCTPEVLRNMLPAGLKVDLVSELAWGDLLGLPSEHLQGDQEAVERSVEFTAGSSFPIRKDLIAAVDASKRPKLLGTRREWLRSHTNGHPL